MDVGFPEPGITTKCVLLIPEDRILRFTRLQYTITSSKIVGRTPVTATEQESDGNDTTRLRHVQTDSRKIPFEKHQGVPSPRAHPGNRK